MADFPVCPSSEPTMSVLPPFRLWLVKIGRFYRKVVSASLFAEMLPKLKNVPYEKYPRGRVTMIAKNYPNDGTFRLMADVNILQQKECVAEIKRVFNLTDKQNVEVLRDAHYRT